MSIWNFVLNHLDLNIHAIIKKVTLRNMLGSIPHQKFCFYHLPTRGRAGIKLGDAWYVSNLSIIFDCTMLLYYPFWMFMSFTLHFYIIFGTNLLTGGPTQIAVFFAYFSVSKKRNIKWSPNGMKPSGAIFFEQTHSKRLGVTVKKQSRWPRGCLARPRGVGAPPPSWAPRGSPDRLSLPIYTCIPWKHRGAPRNPISTAATFCTREIPSWSLFRCSIRGGISHGGLLHHRQGLSDEFWVVYHRPGGHRFH